MGFEGDAHRSQNQAVVRDKEGGRRTPENGGWVDDRSPGGSVWLGAREIAGVSQGTPDCVYAMGKGSPHLTSVVCEPGSQTRGDGVSNHRRSTSSYRDVYSAQARLTLGVCGWESPLPHCPTVWILIGCFSHKFVVYLTIALRRSLWRSQASRAVRLLPARKGNFGTDWILPLFKLGPHPKLPSTSRFMPSLPSPEIFAMTGTTGRNPGWPGAEFEFFR